MRSQSASIIQYLIVVGLISYAAYGGAQSMGYNWQWYRVPQFFWTVKDGQFVWGPLPLGLLNTMILSIVSFVLALLMGFGLAFLRLSKLVIGNAFANVVMELVRNTPILVQVYVFYYVLGPIFDLDRFTASIMALAVFHAALISEIVRAGIVGVKKGQWEAADAIALTRLDVYRYVILPQAIRMVLPAMTSEGIHVLKNSAIVSVIAVAELTTAGRNIISDTFMSFEIWLTIAAVYFVVTVALSASMTVLEKKYAISQ
ncbi:MAG: amino acid ABC transporter permease [Alphaproteobacteria bacterium]|nr:amino acid ABC transporter permease [Alphaproteobacteria bacterium]